jgi:UDP-3-O-acyl N-acetylglucosamine deacetylase
MRSIRFQQTILRSFQVHGRGYWTGVPVTLTFHPADPDTGICFRRTDLPHQPVLPAVAGIRSETQLRTRLTREGASVDMVEHVVSALVGMQVDNCLVDCDAPEMPGLDGSAMAYALGIQQVGLTRQDRLRKAVVIEQPIRIGDNQQWVMAMPCSDPYPQLEYRLDYGPKHPISAATASFSLGEGDYLNSIAPARTFVTQEEAQQLQSRGLARHVSYRELLVFGDAGPIDNTLRFADECARHKLLDLIGDLALCGYSIVGRIVAFRSGHVLNGRMAESLWRLAQRTTAVPQVA